MFLTFLELLLATKNGQKKIQGQKITMEFLELLLATKIW